MADIHHVLFDADGVLQDVPGGLHAAMEPYLGDRAHEFLHKAWKEELPTLAGRGDYMPLFAAALVEYGVTAPVESVYIAVWQNIVIVDETLKVVEALRREGYGVHLGTNQERHRAEHMRAKLGYDALFDVSCYSYELGVAKPDPEFFVEAARRIAAEPETILFIDDSAKNVDGARGAGFAAEQWHYEWGRDSLLGILLKHDIRLTAVTAGAATRPSPSSRLRDDVTRSRSAPE